MIHASIRVVLTAAAAGILAIAVLPAGAASADTAIDGPVGLGTAESYSVLGASTVTNTGPSVLGGDLGLSPGSAITGFPPGTVGGTIHATDEVAAQAQVDLTTAYGVAASLTPTMTGVGDLTGASLTPGVYSGGEVSLTGELTLEGAAESVWVFQAASTLTIASGSLITVTGGASACNVFWQVGTSATIQPGAQFVGTVMANESVTAQTGATITGRLLARTGAVTLDTNTIIASTGCEAGSVSVSPEFTSETPPAGTEGDEYTYTVTASGTPAPTFTVTSGELPPGLVLDEETGVISGTPTAPGTYEFEITASNGTGPDAVTAYSITIAAAAVVIVPDVPTDETPALAVSGADGPTALFAGIVLSLGLALLFLARHRSSRMSHAGGADRRPPSAD